MKSGGGGVYHEDQYRSLSVSWVGIVQGNKEHLIVISWWKGYKPACAKWESAWTQIEVSLDSGNISNCDHVVTCWAMLACSKLISWDRCAVPLGLKWQRMKRNCQRVACLLIFQYDYYAKYFRVYLSSGGADASCKYVQLSAHSWSKKNN